MAQSLRLARPVGKIGSGITILVGPNSGGKSTIVEALGALSKSKVAFSVGRRNALAGNRVCIRAELEAGTIHVLQTVDSGGSETAREPPDPLRWYVLPSRRFFSPYFGRAMLNRQSYVSSSREPATRSTELDGFPARLFNALKDRDKFNAVLSKVVDPVPNWTIDQSDEGRYFINIDSNGQHHNSDGLGEGIVSILFVVDALYDSSPGDVIVIDEPELSLHPVYQRRLLALFGDYARDRQIIYATHSPHFVEFRHILSGAEVARIHKERESSRISQVGKQTIAQLQGLVENLNNPHILGLTAREAFFQQDGVIVVEGQDDVVHYGSLVDELHDGNIAKHTSVAGLGERFFGWGAGGADNIEKVLMLLRDLGLERVVAVVDKNKSYMNARLHDGFPQYRFYSIPADDIRTKPARKGQASIYGLLDEERRLRREFMDDTIEMFRDIRDYLFCDGVQHDGDEVLSYR